MNENEQRIAIAEACGWVASGYHSDNDSATPPCFNGRFWRKGGYEKNEPPNYLNDLNAMHEAEKTLDFATHGKDYWNKLATVVLGGPDDNLWECKFIIATATASQRAEAFLRTIGKWKE